MLPTSAAYARILLREGKATRLPHPAITHIQLSTTVDEPSAQPVLLTVQLHRQQATLLAVTQRAAPALHLTVDLQTTFHHKDERLVPVNISNPDDVLAAAVQWVQRLLPVSHLILVAADGQQHSFSASFGTVAQQALLSSLTSPAPPDFPSHLWASSQVLLGSQLPTLMACALHQQHAVSILPRAQGNAPLTAGSVVHLHHEVRLTFGLLGAVHRDTTLDVLLPTLQTTGIRWQSVTVAQAAVVRHWPVSGLAVLPAVSEQE